MKRVVREQRLGFYATVCADGSPNLSPKGTTYVLDDEHLFFAMDRVKAIVTIAVQEARAVVSPAYDDGVATEADVIRTFKARYASLHGDEAAG
jgi:hypothetical protein